MDKSERDIRVAQTSERLAAIGRDVAQLVTDAYAAGYADGLARADRAESESEPLDLDDVVTRRPTRV